MKIRKSLFGLFGLLVLVAGCPDSNSISPRETCEGQDVAVCERLYSCLSPQEIKARNLPTEESACVIKFDDLQGCAAKNVDNACTGNETFHSTNANTCLDQLAGLECSQLQSANFDIEKAAPACNLVCSID